MEGETRDFVGSEDSSIASGDDCFYSCDPKTGGVA